MNNNNNNNNNKKKKKKKERNSDRKAKTRLLSHWQPDTVKWEFSSSTKNNVHSKQKSTVATKIIPGLPPEKNKVNWLGETDYNAKRKTGNMELRR